MDKTKPQDAVRDVSKMVLGDAALEDFPDILAYCAQRADASPALAAARMPGGQLVGDSLRSIASCLRAELPLRESDEASRAEGEYLQTLRPIDSALFQAMFRYGKSAMQRLLSLISKTNSALQTYEVHPELLFENGIHYDSADIYTTSQTNSAFFMEAQRPAGKYTVMRGLAVLSLALKAEMSEDIWMVFLMDKDPYEENKMLYLREVTDPSESYPAGLHIIHLNCAYAQTVDFTNPPSPEDGMNPADWIELLKFAHDFVTQNAEQMLLPEMAALKRTAVSRLLGA